MHHQQRQFLLGGRAALPRLARRLGERDDHLADGLLARRGGKGRGVGRLLALAARAEGEHVRNLVEAAEAAVQVAERRVVRDDHADAAGAARVDGVERRRRRPFEPFGAHGGAVCREDVGIDAA